MTRWLAAARQASEARTELTELNPRAQGVGDDTARGGVLSVKSVLSDEEGANPAPLFKPLETNAHVAHETTTHPPDEEPHGLSAGGRPRTWTGKVVSLEEWRQLLEWDRHGPDGRRWDGLSSEWR